MVPSINFEWHPYSVANSELVDQLLFLIEAKGDWSTKLYNKIKSKSDDYLILRGPFLTSSTEIISNNKEKQICIAGGIGISPFISVMDTWSQLSRCNVDYRENYLLMFGHKMQQKQSIAFSDIIETRCSTHTRHNLKVVWIFNDPNKVHHLFEYIKSILIESASVDLDIYITGKFKGDSKVKKIFNVLRLLDGSNSCINVFFERPNFTNMLSSENYRTLYFCGSNRLELDVHDACKANGVVFKCEKFD
jgi:predicted ferric reductase